MIELILFVNWRNLVLKERHWKTKLFVSFFLFVLLFLNLQMPVAKSDISKPGRIQLDSKTYFYVDKDNIIHKLSSKAPYYAFAFTDPWKGMSGKSRKHIGFLSIKEQFHNACFIEYELTHKGIGNSGKWSKQAAAAVVGNLIEEVRTNPGQWERWCSTKKKQSGYGLCQWTPSKTFFKRTKLSINTANKYANVKSKKLLKIQLKYMWQTMTDKKVLEWYEKMGKRLYGSPYKMTAKQFIKSKKSTKKLAMVFCACYLRPGDIKEQFKRRSRRAYDWYKNRKIRENWDDED